MKIFNAVVSRCFPHFPAVDHLPVLSPLGMISHPEDKEVPSLLLVLPPEAVDLQEGTAYTGSHSVDRASLVF